jgi:HTH-type transcriptional regulator, bacterioopsin transcriptional activator and related proteins
MTILVFDADRTITFGNERAKEVLGTEEIEGTPFSEFPWELLEGDEPAPAERRPFDLVRRRDEPVYDLQYPALIDGERRWLSINGAPLYDDGEFDGAVFVTDDVTDRKRREEALSTLHEAGARMMRSDSDEEIYELTVAAAAAMLPVSKAAIYAIDTTDYALRPVAHSPGAAGFVEERPEIAEDSPIWRAFVEGEPRFSAGIEPPTAAFPLGNYGVLVTGDREGLCDEGASLARVLCDDAEVALERADREAVLREQRATLRRANEQLERLNHVIDLMRNVTRATVGAGSREEITTTVCERLAAADSYRFAWIGAAVDGTIVPEAWAGITRPHLEGLDLSLDDGRSATVRALRTGEPVVERALVEGRDAERRTDALSRNYRSTAAVSISYRDRSYGVLCVYADRDEAFDERERDVLGELGETVGHAIDALETRDALVSDGAWFLAPTGPLAGSSPLTTRHRSGCGSSSRGSTASRPPVESSRARRSTS